MAFSIGRLPRGFHYVTLTISFSPLRIVYPNRLNHLAFMIYILLLGFVFILFPCRRRRRRQVKNNVRRPRRFIIIRAEL